MLTNQMQEVQMLFVLVENIVNQLFLVPAHHVVILSPFFEVDFRTIVSVLLRLLFVVVYRRPGQGRRVITPQPRAFG